jgi:hypothetical protein
VFLTKGPVDMKKKIRVVISAQENFSNRSLQRLTDGGGGRFTNSCIFSFVVLYRKTKTELGEITCLTVVRL